VSSHVLHLQLNEIDVEVNKKADISDLISPINIRDNKHFRINTNDLNEKGGEKSIINLISPANDDKQAFDFGKNNFLPRKNSTKISENIKNENTKTKSKSIIMQTTSTSATTTTSSTERTLRSKNRTQTKIPTEMNSSKLTTKTATTCLCSGIT